MGRVILGAKSPLTPMRPSIVTRLAWQLVPSRSLHQSTVLGLERDTNVLRNSERWTTWKKLRATVFESQHLAPDTTGQFDDIRRVSFVPPATADERIPFRESKPLQLEERRDLPEVESETPEHVPPPPMTVAKTVVLSGISSGYGRRKSARAAVTLRPGTGRVLINGLPALRVYPHIYLRTIMMEPLIAAEQVGMLDMTVSVHGGGFSGQVQAIRHAIANALVARDPELHFLLHSTNMLRRDLRVKERKHTGLRKARKAQQWVKR